jgi:hypothetical protein
MCENRFKLATAKGKFACHVKYVLSLSSRDCSSIQISHAFDRANFCSQRKREATATNVLGKYINEDLSKVHLKSLLLPYARKHVTENHNNNNVILNFSFRERRES